MKLRRNIHRAQTSKPRSLRFMTLCAFFAAGIAAGQVAAALTLRNGSGAELTAYLQRFSALLVQGEQDIPSVLRVFSAYFQVPLLVLLLGYCSFGAVAIPLVCAAHGFALAFSAACFLGAFGRQGLLLVLAAMGVRAAVTVFCALVLGQWAFHRALCRLRGKRLSPDKESAAERRQVFLCIPLLLLAALFELTVVPQLLQAALEQLFM